MAAKDKEIEKFRMGKGGPGWKSCPECSGFVSGPLTKTCPNCSHEFSFKSRVKTEGTASSPPSSNLEAALLFALSAGSVAKAKASIEALKSNPCMAFAIASGGIEGALAALTKVEGKLTPHNAKS